MKQMMLTEPIQTDIRWQTSRDSLPKGEKKKHLEQVFQNKGPASNTGIYSLYRAIEFQIAIQNY